MFGYIYETTNIINGNTYIGKKKGTFDEKYYGSGTILKRALEKYGKENFKVEIITICESEELLNFNEKFYIEERNPTYNIAKGGTGGDTLFRASNEYKQEVIDKRRLSLSNAWNTADPEKRKKWGEAISKSKKGISTIPKGYKHSDEVKFRIKESNKKVKKSETWYENHSNAMEKRRGISNTHSQVSVEIDGIVYDGITIAATSLGVSRQSINAWIKKGKAKYVK